MIPPVHPTPMRLENRNRYARQSISRSLTVSVQLWWKIPSEEKEMSERFERHRQPWTSDEIQKLHKLASKGMSLKAIGKALTRSEESIQTRARQDGLKISKMR